MRKTHRDSDKNDRFSQLLKDLFRMRGFVSAMGLWLKMRCYFQMSAHNCTFKLLQCNDIQYYFNVLLDANIGEYAYHITAFQI